MSPRRVSINMRFPSKVDDAWTTLTLFCLRCEECKSWIESLPAHGPLLLEAWSVIGARVASGLMEMDRVEEVVGNYDFELIRRGMHLSGDSYQHLFNKLLDHLERLGCEPFREYEARIPPMMNKICINKESLPVVSMSDMKLRWINKAE